MHTQAKFEDNMKFSISDLQKKCRKEYQVCFPCEFANKHYAGEMSGYYIPNTKYFNVYPNNVSRENLPEPIGFIFKECPFEIIESGIQEELRNENLTDETKKLFDFLNRENRKVLGEAKKSYQLKNKSSLDNFKSKIFNDKDPNFQSAQYWLDRIYSLDETTNKDILVGFWNDEKLEFVHFPSLEICKQTPYSLELDVFSRNVGILETAVMNKCGVILIGCGSVNSLLALELAKAGVGKFFLVDNDIMGYHNICRHQCSMRDVGKYKTEAIKERILDINPFIKIEHFNCKIEDVPIDSLNEFANEDCIIVSGADNRDGDLYGSSLSEQLDIPFVSIGCWERASAGEIFYCIPNQTPSYRTFLNNFGIESGRVYQNRNFYTHEEDIKDTFFEPGIAVDIDFVTIIGAKLIIDILNRKNTDYIPKVVNALTEYTLICNSNDERIGGERVQIFSYPLQITRSISIVDE